MSEAVATKPVPMVFAAMQAVQREMLQGVGKNNVNKEQKYKYRSIEDVVNAMAPVLVANDLMIVPHCRSAVSSEYITKSGTKMQRVVMHMDYKILCTKDGSEYTASIANEGSDMTDKASNKCLSFCYKYMLAQAFCIPFADMGDDDGDNGRGYSDKAADTRQGAGNGNSSPSQQAQTKQNTAQSQNSVPANNAEAKKEAIDTVELRRSELKKVQDYATTLCLTGGLDNTKIEPGKFYDEWKDIVESPSLGKKIEGITKTSLKTISLDKQKGVMWQVLRWNWYLCNVAGAAGDADSLAIINKWLNAESILSPDAVKLMRDKVAKAHVTYDGPHE